MGLFDIFSKKKDESQDTELRQQFAAFQEDFAKLQKQVAIINGDMTTLYNYVKGVAQNEESNVSRQEIKVLESKMKEFMIFARLSVQNHDEITEIKHNMHTFTHPQKESIEKRELGSIKDMSPKEREIISILINSEIPLSNTEIGSRMSISPITVKGHINSIKRRYGSIILEILRGRNKKEYQIDRTFRQKVLAGN